MINLKWIIFWDKGVQNKRYKTREKTETTSRSYFRFSIQILQKDLYGDWLSSPDKECVLKVQDQFKGMSSTIVLHCEPSLQTQFP
jgi:hypothetical protein